MTGGSLAREAWDAQGLTKTVAEVHSASKIRSPNKERMGFIKRKRNGLRTCWVPRHDDEGEREENPEPWRVECYEYSEDTEQLLRDGL